MPAFGVKIDAVPGRLNETWFKADEEGLYYGQCSEIGGNKDHAFMPIAIRVVSEQQVQRMVTRQLAVICRAPIRHSPHQSMMARISMWLATKSAALCI